MKMHKTGAALLAAATLVVGVIAGCGGSDGAPADVVLRGGKVVTMDGQRRVAQALAVLAAKAPSDRATRGARSAS